MINQIIETPGPELRSGAEGSSFSDGFRGPGPEPSVLSVGLAGSGPVVFFIDSPSRDMHFINIYKALRTKIHPSNAVKDDNF